ATVSSPGIGSQTTRTPFVSVCKRAFISSPIHGGGGPREAWWRGRPPGSADGVAPSTASRSPSPALRGRRRGGALPSLSGELADVVHHRAPVGGQAVEAFRLGGQRGGERGRGGADARGGMDRFGELGRVGGGQDEQRP